MSFYDYLVKVKDNPRQAIKIEWLNPDETVNFEFTNLVYDINVNVSVNYQNGSRRSCTVTLNNDRNKIPISFNNIWFGQKFKLWMGIYLDEKTPYLLPQGVFYVTNPNEVFNPSTRTVTIQGVDKWAYLDGTLFGYLEGTYKTDIGTNLYEATKNLLLQPTRDFIIDDYFNIKNNNPYYFRHTGGEFRANNTGNNSSTAITELIARCDLDIKFDYSYNTEQNYDKFTLTVNSNTILNSVSGNLSGVYEGHISKGDKITFKYKKDGSNQAPGEYVIISNFQFQTTQKTQETNVIDPAVPLLSPYFLTKTVDIKKIDDSGNTSVITQGVLLCPYEAKVDRGQTYADVLLEYATILCASIYYDVNGRLVIEPQIDTADDITDTDKEVLWEYSVDENTFLGLSQTFNFDKVYNDFIVLGNVVNGYQFKGRVQNRNPKSNTCIQKIGIKTKPPIEDNQYVSDDQCIELAKYHAKTDTIIQKSGNIDSILLYHLDVNKLVSVSTPNNNMGRELFLITGFSLPSKGKMSLNISSVNILKDFSVVTV